MKAFIHPLTPLLAMLTQGLLPVGVSNQALAQTDSQITRDGGEWVQTSMGTIPLVCSGCRLRVNTDGNLMVRGQSSGNEISFSLKKRVRAGSFQEAQMLLRQFEIRSKGQGNLVTLTLMTPRRRAHGAELSIGVPRSVNQAMLESVAGDLRASDLDGRVEAATAAGRVELDRMGSDAVIRTGGGEIRIGRVAGAVRCFSGGGGIQAESCGRESWFETAGGDILIREALAAVHASTSGGNIRVDRSGGEVFAHTAAGVIEVQQAAGLVNADNSGGAIQVGAARGVRCESVAGAIRLRNLGSGPLRASTALGSILAELLSGARLEDSLLSTNAGDITVLLASNIPITVQARNETSGGGRRIVSDFPEIRIRNISGGAGFPLLAEGMLNGGGPVLRIFASGGTIYLRRQK